MSQMSHMINWNQFPAPVFFQALKTILQVGSLQFAVQVARLRSGVVCSGSITGLSKEKICQDLCAAAGMVGILIIVSLCAKFIAPPVVM